MTTLRVEDFGEYFRGVHGAAPFPWQRRLLEQVASEGRWPRLLDLPTGVGKTAAIDVALFHRALEAGAAERRAPTRIVVVVDRRAIVDQTVDRARRIRRRLDDADQPVLREVGERLRASSVSGETNEVLHVATLRGGMAREVAWARRPDQPTILVSTVDQVGSRLLFRGYGVSASMRPIHAGLLGSDTLFLLDEVHLSEPFKQTLGAIADRYREWAEHPLDRRWQVVEMSATPSSTATTPFRLGVEDHEDPKLKLRLRATKPIQLLEPIKVSGGEAARSRKFAEAVASAALSEGKPVPGKAVGVVVNRVRTARSAFSLLSDRCGDRATVLLLTGRMRPADREKVQAEIGAKVGAGRPDRASNARATIVVATQCIEAGADLDFDILVSECASWDALKQRFGRLNRLGDVQDCRGTVLIRSDQVEASDAVYGEALAKTWAWLRGRGEDLDIGLSGTLAAEPCPPDCLPERAEAPLMLPAHLDSWCQTNPVPEPDPEVALWLHGTQREVAEVQIVWRADLTEGDLLSTGARLDALRERINLFPPSAGEALSVPLHAARAWLERKVEEASDFPDVPFVEAENNDESGSEVLPALLWRGDDSEVVAEVDEVKPGDTLVVPASYGGLTAYNWDPSAKVVVRDVADWVAMAHRKLPFLRLLPEVIESDFGVDVPPPPRVAVEEEEDVDDDEAVDTWLGRVRAGMKDEDWRAKAIDALRARSRRRILRIDPQWVDGQGRPIPGYYAVVARRRTDVTTEDDSSSFTGVAVSLDDHLQGVATWAGALARGAGLPADLAEAVECAGRWHDVGKADPRFQLLLHGGDSFKHALSPSLLAKSSAPGGDYQTRRKAALRSGYPRGARHELMSLALMSAAPDQAAVPPRVDRDLVLHLVASHHGYCRPLPPVAFDADPRVVEYRGPNGVLRAASDHQLAAFDSGVSARFFALIRRYGWFGLAWMEAILRLADHRRSEAEQMKEV